MHAIHPSVGPDLCFIGFSRPTSGAVPGCSELVARYHALLLSGKRVLPSNIDALTMQDKIHEEALFVRSPQVRSLVNPCEYMDSLACLIGCFQSPWAYWNQPINLFRWVAGANLLARFRLVGPHAKPGMAREWLDKVTLPLPAPVVLFVMFWKLAFCVGLGTGDFIVDARTKWGIEVTKVIGIGAPPSVLCSSKGGK